MNDIDIFDNLPELFITQPITGVNRKNIDIRDYFVGIIFPFSLHIQNRYKYFLECF